MFSFDRPNYSRKALRPQVYLSHVITITSETGVGSSSTLKALKEHHERSGSMIWRYVSGGGIMRSFAEELGMSIEEFAAYNRAHPEKGYDERCDEDMSEYGRQNRTILEGRLPHVFVPHAFHVRLTCPLAVRAERRRHDLGLSADATSERIHARDLHDNARYEMLYPGCLWPDDDFDDVIRTEELSTEAIVRRIIAKHAQWRHDPEKKIDHSISLI